MEDLRKLFTDEALIRTAIDCCFKVYRKLGRYVLEHAYQIALAHELQKEGLEVEVEKNMDLTYDDMVIENAYRADLIVNSRLIIELKAAKKMLPEFHSQIATYMVLSNIPNGLLVNFHAELLRNEIYRKSLHGILEYKSNFNNRQPK